MGQGQLGDAAEIALSRAGITSDRISKWVGNCGCEERKAKLNALGIWAVRFLRGKTEGMVSYLDRLLEGDER